MTFDLITHGRRETGVGWLVNCHMVNWQRRADIDGSSRFLLRRTGAEPWGLAGKHA
jgi:hypothetical protein